MSDRHELHHRFSYHQPTSDAIKADHQFVRGTIEDVAGHLTDMLPQCRELSLAITKLEEAMFWANAAIARNQYSKAEWANGTDAAL